MTATGTEAQFRALLDQFAEGWNQGEPHRMADAFLLDGVLQMGPFETPLKGRPAILDYWRDVPLAQSNVSFRYGEIFVVGPWFATEFRCTYQRRRSGEAVDVKGAVFCETREGKFAEMRMYWERRVTSQAAG